MIWIVPSNGLARCQSSCDAENGAGYNFGVSQFPTIWSSLSPLSGQKMVLPRGVSLRGKC
jgi:hypothetical protein